MPLTGEELELKFRRSVTKASAFWLGILCLAGMVARVIAGNISFHPVYIAVILALGFAMILIALLTYYQFNLKACALSLLICLNLIGLFSCFANGGMRAPASVIFVVTPMIGYLILGLLGGTTAFGLSQISLAAIALLETYGYPFTELEPARYAVLKCLIYSFGVALTFCCGKIYETLRKQSQARLELAYHKLENLSSDLQLAQSAARLGSWHFDLDHRTLYWSPQLFELLGIPKTETPQIDLYLSHFTEKNQEFLDIFTSNESLMENRCIERRATRKDGSTLDVIENFHIHVSPHGVPLRINGTIQDITERRAREDEQNSQRATLAMTAKMAALGEMAAGLAHEINNPLGIINGKAQLLQRELMRDSATLKIDHFKSSLGTIIRTIERIEKIVSGMRSFSRNAGNDPMQQEKIITMIHDTLELCGQRIRNHNIDIQVTCDEDLAILCRPSQIVQVLANLLSNAHDAILTLEERWIRIEVQAIGDAIEIKVIDSGRGIPPEIVHKMMQPFFTSKPVGKGTGLGLSISKGLVENHGGSFSYDQKSEHTCFKMTFTNAWAASLAAA